MLNANKLLIEQVLASKFNLIVITINSLEEKQETVIKIKKKTFLSQIGTMDLKVKLVEQKPPVDMEIGRLYIEKNGKIAWIKEEEA